jgi:hypothetical protein
MQPVEQKKKQTSPWLYVGIGCGALVLLGVVGSIAAVVFGENKIKEISEDMSNPVTRTEKVKKMLGAQTLPEGYFAIMALSVPVLMDTAVLSTSAPDAPKKSRKGQASFFVYLLLKAASVNDQEELREYLDGRSDDASVLTRNKVRIHTEEIIGRGAIQLEGHRLLYLTQRGELGSSSGHDSTEPGINAIILIECPGETRLQMGLWIAPDPSPGTPLAQLELKGTPADPEALRAFMSHLNPCQEN